MSVLFFCACSAHLEALNILRIVEKRTMYMQPYDRLISAETNDSSASVFVTGSSAASGTWKMLSIALKELFVSGVALEERTRDIRCKQSGDDVQRLPLPYQRIDESLPRVFESEERRGNGCRSPLVREGQR